MSRVTPTEVRVIITTSLTDPAIQVWIDVANTIVNDNADCIAGDEAKLTQIELNLSAHFVGMLDPAIKQSIKKEGPAGFETTYTDPAQFANTINQTPYGTAANYLSDGCLTKLEKQTIRMFALGSQ